MAFDNNRNNSPRQTFSGNWTCSKCGAAITELPFEPREDRLGELACFDCFKKDRPRNDFRSGGRNNSGPREMFEGNWTCSDCGKEITKLPFQPDPARVGGLKCLDCHKNSR